MFLKVFMQKTLIVFFFFVFYTSFSLLAQESAIADAMNRDIKISVVPTESIEPATNKISFLHGWSLGFNFGLTKFKGDVTMDICNDNGYIWHPESKASLNSEYKANGPFIWKQSKVQYCR